MWPVGPVGLLVLYSVLQKHHLRMKSDSKHMTDAQKQLFEKHRQQPAISDCQCCGQSLRKRQESRSRSSTILFRLLPKDTPKDNNSPLGFLSYVPSEFSPALEV